MSFVLTDWRHEISSRHTAFDETLVSLRPVLDSLRQQVTMLSYVVSTRNDSRNSKRQQGLVVLKGKLEATDSIFSPSRFRLLL